MRSNVSVDAMKCTSVPRRSVVPATASGATGTPRRNSIWWILPLRQMLQLQPVGQRVDHRHADAVQAARHLVAVLVELAARVQLGHHDFGGGAMLVVVVLDVGRDAAAVVDHRYRVVGVDDDLDVVAVSGQRLVDRVVEDFEHHVVQARAVGRVADVHAGPLAHRVEALQDLDAGGIVVVAVLSRLRLCWGHRDFRFSGIGDDFLAW